MSDPSGPWEGPPPPPQWPPQQGQPWQPPPPPPPNPWQPGGGQPYGWQQPKRSRTPLVIGLIVAVVVVVGVIGALAYFGSQLGGLIGGTALQDLAVGQCFNGARAQPGTSSTVVFGVEVVECTMPHTSELAASLDYPGGASGVAYPGVESVSAFAQQECHDGFADYVGVSFEESVLDMTFVYPLESNWRSGDYSIQCVVHPQDGQETVSVSFRNSGL